MFAYYNEKMQTLLSPQSAIALLKIYGVDYFTQINILDGTDYTKTIEKDINPRGLLRADRLKKVCSIIRKIEKTKHIQVEFLKK